jgi:hypothetical protein
MTTRTRHKLLSLTFLALPPFVAHAEQRLTYRCNGIESAQGGVDIHTQKRISEDAFQLAVDSDGRLSWTVSIDRADGTWNQTFSGGATSTAGKCRIVKLRVPPSP